MYSFERGLCRDYKHTAKGFDKALQNPKVKHNGVVDFTDCLWEGRNRDPKAWQLSESFVITQRKQSRLKQPLASPQEPVQTPKAVPSAAPKTTPAASMTTGKKRKTPPKNTDINCPSKPGHLKLECSGRKRQSTPGSFDKKQRSYSLTPFDPILAIKNMKTDFNVARESPQIVAAKSAPMAPQGGEHSTTKPSSCSENRQEILDSTLQSSLSPSFTSQLNDKVDHTRMHIATDATSIATPSQHCIHPLLPGGAPPLPVNQSLDSRMHINQPTPSHGDAEQSQQPNYASNPPLPPGPRMYTHICPPPPPPTYRNENSFQHQFPHFYQHGWGHAPAHFDERTAHSNAFPGNNGFVFDRQQQLPPRMISHDQAMAAFYRHRLRIAENNLSEFEFEKDLRGYRK